MAKTRNQRRKAAKVRLAAKTERIAKASIAAEQQARRDIVLANLNAPKARTYPVRSCLAGISGMSHRGYVCRASGSGKDR